MNIRQLAKKAGVSVATVSRVMNHPENVAPETKEKIERIIAETEYTPNWFARGLNLNRTATIGLMVPQILYSENMEIVKGAEDVAHQKNYTALICNVENDPAKERKYVDTLIKRRVDGILLISSLLSEKEIEAIQEQGTAMVHIGEPPWQGRMPAVSIDCKDASVRIVSHLIESGARNVAILYGKTPEAENRRKLAGYEEALREAGIPVNKKYQICMEDSIEDGYLGAKKLLDSGRPPQAIFATSDIMAFGVLDAMKDCRIRVPEEIAVAGFGNIRMSNIVEPKLTTIEKPLHKMGVLGARLLFDLIESKDAEGSRNVKEIFLQSKLKIRKSCGHTERIGEMF